MWSCYFHASLPVPLLFQCRETSDVSGWLSIGRSLYSAELFCVFGNIKMFKRKFKFCDFSHFENILVYFLQLPLQVAQHFIWWMNQINCTRKNWKSGFRMKKLKHSICCQLPAAVTLSPLRLEIYCIGMWIILWACVRLYIPPSRLHHNVSSINIHSYDLFYGSVISYPGHQVKVTACYFCFILIPFFPPDTRLIPGFLFLSL